MWWSCIVHCSWFQPLQFKIEMYVVGQPPSRWWRLQSTAIICDAVQFVSNAHLWLEYFEINKSLFCNVFAALRLFRHIMSLVYPNSSTSFYFVSQLSASSSTSQWKLLLSRRSSLLGLRHLHPVLTMFDQLVSFGYFSVNRSILKWERICLQSWMMWGDLDR